MNENTTGTTPLIGIAGLKQSGKSTAAAALAKRGYLEDSFAGDLKKIVYHTRGIRVLVPPQVAEHYPELHTENLVASYQDVVDTIGLDQAKELIPDIRLILQTFRTEGMRETFGPDVWVNRLISRVRDRQDKGINTVVSDLRFPNEVEAIKKAGGLTIRVVRPTQENSTDPHPSETHVANLDVDLEIANDSTIEELGQKVLKAAIGNGDARRQKTLTRTHFGTTSSAKTLLSDYKRCLPHRTPAQRN